MRDMEMAYTFPRWELKVRVLPGADWYMLFHLSLGSLNEATTSQWPSRGSYLQANKRVLGLTYSVTLLGASARLYPN
jgi:hypothetical protein